MASAPAAFAADPPAKQAAAPSVATPSTSTFLTNTAVANLFEIESSKVALAKTKNDKIKAFANQMVTDHTGAGTKFKQAVADAKLTPPAFVEAAPVKERDRSLPAVKVAEQQQPEKTEAARKIEVMRMEGPSGKHDGWARSARPGGLGQRSSCAHGLNAHIGAQVADGDRSDRRGPRLK